MTVSDTNYLAGNQVRVNTNPQVPNDLKMVDQNPQWTETARKPGGAMWGLKTDTMARSTCKLSSAA